MAYRSQAIASVVLGTPLTFGIGALYAQFGPGEPATAFITAVFLLLPLWTTVLIWGLKRAEPSTAWLGLGVALALVAMTLILARKAMSEG